jgi:hypothetical protein
MQEFADDLVTISYNLENLKLIFLTLHKFEKDYKC